MSRTLPRAAAQLTEFHEAWIIGSMVPGAKDIDLLVPWSHWPQAALLIPTDARPNAFGGWKFNSEGVELDVFPGDLAMLLSLGKCRSVYHPKSGQRFTRE